MWGPSSKLYVSFKNIFKLEIKEWKQKSETYWKNFEGSDMIRAAGTNETLSKSTYDLNAKFERKNLRDNHILFPS